MKKITLLMLIVFMTITVQAQNKLLSSTLEFYSNGSWENRYGTNYEYDSNNNLTKETDLRKVDGVWKRQALQTYSYNASNKVVQETYEDWNPETNEVDYKGRSNYSYTNGRVTLMESQKASGLTWINESKTTVTYNSNNLPNVILEYFWENSQWVNEERTTYTYNSNGKIISSIFEEWEGSNWKNSEKTIYTYDLNNKLTLSNHADWDDFNGEWEANGKKEEYEWDATGNKTSETNFYKLGENIQQFKEEYTYAPTAMMSSFAHPFKDKTGLDYFNDGGFPYINKLLTETSNDGNSRTTYNYNSALTLSINSSVIVAKSISIYPNPTTSFLNIQNESNTEIDTVIVTDLLGRKLLERNNATQIDVNNLAKGTYLLEVFVGAKKETRRFIKE